MKQRFTVPFADDHPAAGELRRWLCARGWHISVNEAQYSWGRATWLHLRILLISAPLPVELAVSTGAVLIYDDVEQSMGVTMLAEPQDAVPPRPEDAKPRIPLTELFDDPALRGDRHEERRRRFRP